MMFNTQVTGLIDVPERNVMAMTLAYDNRGCLHLQ